MAGRVAFPFAAAPAHDATVTTAKNTTEKMRGKFIREEGKTFPAAPASRNTSSKPCQRGLDCRAMGGNALGQRKGGWRFECVAQCRMVGAQVDRLRPCLARQRIRHRSDDSGDGD